jgi:hypothetical protein
MAGATGTTVAATGGRSAAYAQDVTDPPEDAFFELAAEIADGERWLVIRADGWDDMQRRLAEAMDDLSVRRRQALIMLIFALVEKIVTPDQVQRWTDERDLSRDEVIEELIGWLRDARRTSG